MTDNTQNPLGIAFLSHGQEIFADDRVVTKTASATLLYTERLVLGNTTSGNITLTLPSAIPFEGIHFAFKKISASNTLTIATSLSQTIEGAATATISANNDILVIFSDGANWRTKISIAGGGAAPTDAAYLLIGANDARFSQERRLGVGTGISLSDGGANSVAEIKLSDFFLLADSTQGDASAQRQFFLVDGLRTVDNVGAQRIDIVTRSNGRVVAGAVSISNEDDFVQLSGTGDYTVTLPTVVGISGKRIVFQKTQDAAANSTSTITIDGNGAETIGGSATYLLTSLQSTVILEADGTSNWMIVSERINDGCRVFNSANISIPNATFTDLTFDSERYDTGGLHNTAANTNRITILKTGIYTYGANVEFALNAVGERALGIFLDNTTFIGLVSQVPGINETRLSLNGQYSFTAGSFITARVFQSSTAALNVLAAGNYSPEFWCRWEGRS